MPVEERGTVGLALHSRVDSEVNVRISKLLGVVRDGSECDGHHGPGQQADFAKEHLRVPPTQREPGQLLRGLRGGKPSH